MRILKKLFIFIIVGLLVTVGIQATPITEFGGAQYRVDETVELNHLPFGITHRRDLGVSGITTLDAQQVNVIEIPASEDIKIVPWGRIHAATWSLSSVRNIAKDFEEKNPGYRVMAAINGDFFDINGTRNFPFATVGVHVANGEFYKTADSGSSTRLTLGFKNDGSTQSLVGNKPLVKSEYMILSIYEDNEIIHEFNIDKVNQTPDDNEIALYYANWDDDKRIVPIDVTNGFVVETATHALAHSPRDFYGIGQITAYTSKSLVQREFAIVSNNPEVTALLAIGTTIRAQYRFADDYADIEYATGCGRPIIYENQFMPDTTVFGTSRHPRTMIGIKADGTILMTTVDGRQPTIGMNGVSQQEMGAILHHYGAVEAYNLDGGGSTTMAILEDGALRVTNSPSDGRERSNSNALLVVVRVPSISYSTSHITNQSVTIHGEILDYNQYQFDDLYIGLNQEFKLVENGKATFTNLASNTTYGFSFYYFDGEEYVDLVIQDRVITAKQLPIIRYVSVYYDGDDLLYLFHIDDPDGAISRNRLTVDDKTALVFNNRALFNEFVGNIGNPVISLGYDLNDGNGRIDIEIDDFKIRCSMNIFMQMAKDRLDNKFQRIIG